MTDWEQHITGAVAAGPTRRLEVVRLLVEAAHGSVAPGPEPDVQAPTALLRFYAMLGNKFALACGQNKVFPPEGLSECEDGKLFFAAENQGVYQWATEPIGEDPPVWGRFEDDDPWTLQSPSLSVFLLEFMILEHIFRGPFGASVAWIDPPKLDEVLNTFRPLPLPVWDWPGTPTRFFARGGALAEVCPNGEDSHSLFVGARQASDVAFLKPFVDDSWEHVALEDAT